MYEKNQWCPALWPAQGIIFPGDRHEKKFDRRLKKSCTFSKKIEHFSKFCQNGIWARDHRHFEMVSKSSPFLYNLKGGDAAEKRGGTRRKKQATKISTRITHPGQGLAPKSNSCMRKSNSRLPGFDSGLASNAFLYDDIKFWTKTKTRPDPLSAHVFTAFFAPKPQFLRKNVKK